MVESLAINTAAPTLEANPPVTSCSWLDPEAETGVDTNLIENVWSNLKAEILKKGEGAEET